MKVSWRSKASRILSQTPLLLKFVEDAGRKLKDHEKVLDEVKVQLSAVLRMLKAWGQGYYRDVPTQSLLMVIGAVLYFLNPLDLIPDFIVGGLVDDVSVLMAVFASIKSDLTRFLEWERQKTP